MAEYLINNATGRWEYVDDPDVTAAIGSGEYSPDPKAPIYVKSPEGEAYEVTLPQALEAIQNGWSIETASQRHKEYQDSRYFGLRKPILALGTGAAAGATLGATDVAIGLAPDSPARDMITEARQEYPLTSIVGEVGGTIASIATGVGPAALLARGGAAAARAITRKGVQKAGERLVARGVVDKGAKVAAAQGIKNANLAGKMAAGIIESVPASVGLTVGNAVLQDQELDHELILASAGIGALAGGALPGFGALGRKAVEKMAPHYASVAAKIGGVSPNDAVGMEAVKKSHPILKAFAPLFAWSSKGGDVEDFVELALKDNSRRLLEKASKTVERHVGGIRPKTDNVHRALNDLQERFGKTTKFRATKEQFEGVDGLQANRSASQAMQDVVDEIDTFSSKRGIVGLTGDLKMIQDEASERALNLAKAMRGEFGDSSVDDLATHAAQQLDEFKKKAQGIISNRSSQMGAPGTVNLPEAIDAITLLRAPKGSVSRVREMLEDENVFGKSFATTQREINAPWSRTLETDTVANSMLLKVGSNNFSPVYKADDKKIRGLVNSGHHEFNTRMEAIKEYYGHVVDTSDAFLKHVDDEGVREAAKRAGRNAREMLKDLDEMHKDVRAQYIAGEMDKVSAGSLSMAMSMGGLAGAAAGEATGGNKWIGSSLGAMAALSLRRPVGFFRAAARIEQTRARFFSGMRTRANAMVRGVPSKARMSMRAERVARMSAISFTAQQTDKNESRAQSYTRIMKELATPNDVVLEKMQSALEPISELSPEVASQIVAKATQGRMFLQAKAAELFGMQAQGIINRDLPPPESQLASWERYVLAVDDPIGTLENVFSGMTTPEEVEVLQVLYPRLYNEQVAAITQELAEANKPPPRHMQVQLSTFFNQDIDGTTGPQWARKVYNRDMQTAGMPQPTNPAGQTGTVNRGQSQRVMDMHQTRGQRNAVA